MIIYDERNLNEFIDQLRALKNLSGEPLKLVFDKTLVRVINKEAKQLAIIDLQYKE